MSEKGRTENGEGEPVSELGGDDAGLGNLGIDNQGTQGLDECAKGWRRAFEK